MAKIAVMFPVQQREEAVIVEGQGNALTGFFGNGDLELSSVDVQFNIIPDSGVFCKFFKGFNLPGE